MILSPYVNWGLEPGYRLIRNSFRCVQLVFLDFFWFLGLGSFGRGKPRGMVGQTVDLWTMGRLVSG